MNASPLPIASSEPGSGALRASFLNVLSSPNTAVPGAEAAPPKKNGDEPARPIVFCGVTSVIATICSPPSNLNFRPTVADELTIYGCADARGAEADMASADAVARASK